MIDKCPFCDSALRMDYTKRMFSCLDVRDHNFSFVPEGYGSFGNDTWNIHVTLWLDNDQRKSLVVNYSVVNKILYIAIHGEDYADQHRLLSTIEEFRQVAFSIKESLIFL